MEADFSGWASKNNLLCSDGRTIMPGAFQHHDGQKVPLVYQHTHNVPGNIMGHAILENRPEGVYAYGYFNGSASALDMKEAVQHGDVTELSIYANGLSERGRSVIHGNIREVSLVLAGANPGAKIENVRLAHADGDIVELDDEIVLSPGLGIELSHASTDTNTEGNTNVVTETNTTADSDETAEDVFETMSEKQQNVAFFMVGEALKNAGVDLDDLDSDTETGGSLEQSAFTADDANVIHHNAFTEGYTMARNAFETPAGAAGVVTQGATLSHDQLKTIMHDATSRNGKLKDSVLSHAGDYGIDNIELLFPDAKSVTDSPDFLSRRVEWVSKVLGAVSKSPFAKIKSIVADITADEARAKGYIKGSEKKEEVLPLLRRTTGPTTVYKKQKLDRDDIIDITDINIVVWIKAEMRIMLDEEIARAILVGDGRSTIDDDKIRDPQGAIDGMGIRSIANDHALYAHTVLLETNADAETTIEEIARSRTHYRGSGTPTMFTTDRSLTDMLLLTDKINRRLYATEAELASVLRVKEIVPVEVLEAHPEILAIIVNLTDYRVGANKGGELTFFEDFDIDFNQEKYLLETRISGALTKPKSAIIIKRKEGTLATPAAPSFNGATNTITVPTSAGVVYLIDGEPVSGSVVIKKNTEITAVADEGYYLEAGSTRTWNFVFTP